jgi:hypothetical protein
MQYHKMVYWTISSLGLGYWGVFQVSDWDRTGATSVDVAVFCLALMGTDYPSFLKEAAR